MSRNNGQANLIPAEPRNQRALKHGATSEQQLGPLRQNDALELSQSFPELDKRRVAILADRLARLESAWTWLDGQGGVVRNSEGDVFPVPDRLEKWAVVAELRLAQAKDERKRHGRRRESPYEWSKLNLEDRCLLRELLLKAET